MEAFLASLAMVTLAEMGDKTQLLSFVLAAKYRGRHTAIILGILVATLANHFMAAFVGDWVAAQVSAGVMRWVLGLGFLAFAAWALVPDTLDEDAGRTRGSAGAFAATLVAFFIAEMGDKTQLATVALGAKYASLAAVVIGTTLGMMAANIPAVLLGERLARYVPLSRMRFIAAALFAVFGVLILLDVDLGLGLASSARA
ncbi:TMEM165/GDT1 family protein [Ramlibacter rhizophilus]|uniref:GDT1 family protein n=1 Tax=Ramlibacter rhizophilus TaxID=1781167 RepID=A0A4Z0BW90_9BURK|nr:TMEM165/GDT1 family protein [Ramlibacter rhizophilus]TFZ03493.1 TMEM165/GDT1 family protein [Ramlibacter rhizophilus]